jgi:DNA polymerase-4
LKTSDFNILTRSHTPSAPPSSCEELTDIALTLRERVDMGSQQRFRLVGVGLSNFHDPNEKKEKEEKEEKPPQPALFE